MVAMSQNHLDELPLKELRILLVEDMGLVAHELKRMLEELGCTVVATAARVDDALNLVNTEDPDGVLLDLRLGGQEAYPVAELLTERQIPFIIMSGYNAAQVRSDFRPHAMLQKPFGLKEMKNAMVRTFTEPDDQ